MDYCQLEALLTFHFSFSFALTLGEEDLLRLFGKCKGILLELVLLDLLRLLLLDLLLTDLFFSDLFFTVTAKVDLDLDLDFFLALLTLRRELGLSADTRLRSDDLCMCTRRVGRGLGLL